MVSPRVEILLSALRTLGPARVKGIAGLYAILDFTKPPRRMNVESERRKAKKRAVGMRIPAFIYNACYGAYVPGNHPADLHGLRFSRELPRARLLNLWGRR